MTLLDMVEKLQSLPQDQTIYAAKPWTSNSMAIVTMEPDDGELPQDAQLAGCSYFLEVFLADEFLAGWLKTHDWNAIEATNRLIHYAVTDA